MFPKYNMSFKELTADQAEMLKDYYYGKKMFYGRDRLYQAIKDEPNHPSIRQTADWLSKQELYQIHYKPKKSHTIRSISVKHPRTYYQADLIDMGKNMVDKKGKRYIFTIIDLFSKKGYAKAMKVKSGPMILATFKRLFPKLNSSWAAKFHTDNGTEFTNAAFKEYLVKKKLRHYTGIPGRPQSQSVIERFNGTLKDLIMKDYSVEKKINWPKKLKLFLDNYNSAYHSTIKMSPNEAELKENIGKIKIYLERRSAKTQPKNGGTKLRVGERVRLRLYKD
eukprot:TRINITY_DN21941_c0_g1_i1.p1 TRINITY_DN21941_c0_g1~~TRINITY_DN21941_c0_g1_i1.p1  ORF type:complete len:279 (-),score=31.74 TRINITY_DN21941_c0_g1_i1:324-1160(-)